MNRRRAIEELRQRIRQLEAESGSLLRQLGEHLSYQPPESFEATPLGGTHARVNELRERLPESRQQVKRILQSAARSEELEKGIRSVRVQLAGLEEEGERICEEIGRCAFEAYRSTRPHEAEYERIFGPLLEQEQELAALEAEMEKAQSGSKSGNFFRIFKESGRSLYVKGLMSLKKKTVARNYREAGHRFCESELVKGITDPELKATLAPYTKNRQKVDALGSEMDTLRSRQEALWKELKELGAERAHQRRVREIENRIERIEEELEDAFGSMGRAYRAKPIKSFAEDPEVKKLLREVSRVEKSAEQHRRQIARIEAAIQLDGVEKQRAAMEDRVERLEREIEHRKSEIRSLSERIEEARKQARRLEELRGSEGTLFKVTERQPGGGDEEQG